MSKVLEYPELKANPFGDRICKVFSSSNDGDITFEDFLDMMSVFSDAAPKSVKAEHAFRIYGRCGENILEEADLDDDGALSFAEFEHIIDKSSDFINSFRIRL
uniref:Uncharacterized protein n=1 Tax=Anopheles atroparvus TaxID=41427 RepID=A0A182IRM9_ANOAO